MRLWHYELIPYLPREMLVAEWRECIAIKRQWEKGALKHRLVSYVQEYDEKLFLYYVRLVVEEMNKRGINYQRKYFDEIKVFCDNKTLADRYAEHNNRYLKQCLYNLQEKADRGIVSKEDWKRIEDKFGGML